MGEKRRSSTYIGRSEKGEREKENGTLSCTVAERILLMRRRRKKMKEFTNKLCVLREKRFQD